MRFRLTVLTLFAVLPVMTVLAAPVPPPSAILDLGPPPKGWSAEKHRDREIDRLSLPPGIVHIVCCDPEVRKLPSIAALKDESDWLAKNMRVKPEGEGNRVRLTFRAGTSAEQAVILNAVLRVYLRLNKERQQFHEKGLRTYEECIRDVEKRIESGQHPGMVDTYRKEINEVRSTRIPAVRAEIARLKQIAVIRWAK